MTVAWILSSPVSAGAETPAQMQAELRAAAQSSPRPPWCGRMSGGFWHETAIARVSDCAAIAQGYSWLYSEPKKASAVAAALLEHDAKNVAALLLDARAQAVSSNFGMAFQRFEQAGIRRPEQLNDAAALHEYSRTLSATMQSGAAHAYRLLLSRAQGLSETEGRRLAAVVEAALAAMRESQAGAAEAVRYLGSYLEDSDYRGNDDVARAVLRLALDRKGVLLPEPQGSREISFEGESRWAPLLLPFERAALEAVLADDGSKQAWQRYRELAPKGDPFLQHAQKRAAGEGP